MLDYEKIIKETMGQDYKKVLWIFQEHINTGSGLVFEYKSRICLNDVISIIMFEKIKQKIIISLYFKDKKEKKKILELNLKEKKSAELILALFKENEKVLLFILDKVMMYYTRNKMTEEFKKLILEPKNKKYLREG